MTYRKFWYYWHTRNDRDSRNGWNTSHSGHSGSWDRLYTCSADVAVWAGRARPTVSRLGPDFRVYVNHTPKWKRFGEYERNL